MRSPLLLAMFHRQIRGDHHLFELAQKKFSEHQIGPEFYPENIQKLQEALEFRPFVQDSRYVIHLPRNINLFDKNSVAKIILFAKRARSDCYGMVIHDQKEISTNFRKYIEIVKELNRALISIDAAPLLFIEYAVGLPFDTYIDIFRNLAGCRMISSCVDISHIGIRQCQMAFRDKYKEIDICKIKPDNPELGSYIDDIYNSSKTALPRVKEIIVELSKTQKNIHFHLHDGHPLSTLSKYGVCDHLSFFNQNIILPFSHQGSHIVPLIFGVNGLEDLLNTIGASVGFEKASLSIEIHPQKEKQELGKYEHLFSNWKIKENAKQMNAWLEEIIKIKKYIEIKINNNY